MRALMIGLAVAVYGCVGSVNVVIPDRATRFESQLLGTWEDSASSEHAVVTQRGLRAYAIDYTDEQGKRLSLLGVLGASRGHLILDLQPAAPGLGAYADLVVRLHIPLILDSIGNSIHVATLERDSLDEYLRRHPRAIAHMRCGRVCPDRESTGAATVLGFVHRSTGRVIEAQHLAVPLGPRGRGFGYVDELVVLAHREACGGLLVHD